MTMPPRPSFDRDADTQPIPRVVVEERKRAAAVLAVLAVAAVLLTLVMVKVLGGSGGNHSAAPPFRASGPAVTVTGSGGTPSGGQPVGVSGSPSTSPAAPVSGSGTPTKTHHPRLRSRPSKRAVSCPTPEPCSLPDDIGDMLGAINGYRVHNGLPPVTGHVTGVARQCALSQGATPPCPDSYYWEPVGRSGNQMLQKVLGRGGAGDLLNPAVHHVQIGWAYLPSSHSFWCALVIG